MVGALICFPQGWLWQGVVVVTIFVFSDMVDGLMAKITGKASSWGAFLDSSLDRLGDAAVFGGILLYFVYRDDSTLWAAVALAGLVFGQWTSYVKARAESLGFTCRRRAGRAGRPAGDHPGSAPCWPGSGCRTCCRSPSPRSPLASMITVFQRIAQVTPAGLAESMLAVR